LPPCASTTRRVMKSPQATSPPLRVTSGPNLQTLTAAPDDPRPGGRVGHQDVNGRLGADDISNPPRRP
jgi:hypothetical protein